MDYLVFTGGIGENSVLVREKICSRLSCLGVKFDREANLAVRGEGRISTSDSPAEVLVLPTNEEVGIAQIIHEKVSAGELSP
jgi:acetate kinase